MKRYPLGFAIVEWHSGGKSDAMFYNDREGVRMIVCANWISPGPVSKIEHDIKNITSDYDDIYMLKRYGEE